MNESFKSFAKISEQQIHRKKAARDISDTFGETKQYSGSVREEGHSGGEKSRVLDDKSGTFKLRSEGLVQKLEVFADRRKMLDILKFIYSAMAGLFS